MKKQEVLDRLQTLLQKGELKDPSIITKVELTDERFFDVLEDKLQKASKDFHEAAYDHHIDMARQAWATKPGESEAADHHDRNASLHVEYAHRHGNALGHDHSKIESDIREKDVDTGAKYRRVFAPYSTNKSLQKASEESWAEAHDNHLDSSPHKDTHELVHSDVVADNNHSPGELIDLGRKVSESGHKLHVSHEPVKGKRDKALHYSVWKPKSMEKSDDKKQDNQHTVHADFHGPVTHEYNGVKPNFWVVTHPETKHDTVGDIAGEHNHHSFVNRVVGMRARKGSSPSDIHSFHDNKESAHAAAQKLLDEYKKK